MPTIEPLGDSAVRVCFGSTIDPDTLDAVQGFVAALARRPLAGVKEAVPAYAVVVVYFDPLALSFEAVRDHLAPLWDGRDAAFPEPRLVSVPVCYGGAFGPDLAAVAGEHGMSEAEVIARHTAPLYRVAMLGFAPGFPYLAGLDPAIATPRLDTPRARVPAGSVGIAGEQTGIYPQESPGGWRLIGRTPLTLFDPAAEPPFLLAPGDRVRFVAIAPEDAPWP